ncbi:MAG: ABC transporter permease [Flavisolibacter sp.]
MIKNYFKTAWRNFTRNKNYSIINISGLSIGISVTLIIFLILQFELSFDTFHKKKDQIYRVLTEYHHADAPDIFYGRGLPAGLPAAIQREFPEIEKVAPVYIEGNDQIAIPDENGKIIKKFKEETGVFFTKPSFFEIFDFPWMAGNPSAALKDPNHVVLTKDIAEKYFGDWKSAIGKIIRRNGKDDLKVSGILATIPPNTDFQMRMVISFGTGITAEMAKSNDWAGTSTSFTCYILLHPGTSIVAFNSRLRAISKKYEPEDDKDSHIIQSLSKVHYDNHVGNYIGKTVSPQLINTLWLISAFILIIACVNFINLATAQAVNRGREVGVRKVLGGNKNQLRSQFLIETFLIVGTSILCACAVTFLSLPAIGKILDIPINKAPLISTYFIIFVLLLSVFLTIVAGFYPSVVLSGFNAITALKSKIQAKSTKGISLRRGLVIFQFVIAQALIIGTLIIAKQMNYFNTASTGFTKEAIITVPFPSDSISISKLDFIRKKVSDVSGIQNISFSSNIPAGEDNNWSTFKFNNALKETDFFAIIKFTDADYFKTYDLKLLEGRNLYPSDTAREFLINESLLKKLGFRKPSDVINKRVELWDGYLKGPVVGVIKDYHDRTFKSEDAPLLLTTFKKGYSLANIQMKPGTFKQDIVAIEKLWNQVYPDYAFEYKFLDAQLADFYKQENQLAQLYKIFAAIAIFLSCLGLYGLASFMAIQRIKEVGIRKVLGATATNIVYLFSKEFVLLIAVAFVIAAPIAAYFMHQWLQDYTYRISVSWWIFLTGGLASIAIALTTVSFKAINAALANPVKNLRTE